MTIRHETSQRQNPDVFMAIGFHFLIGEERDQ